jgi:hypothetical protein
LRSTRSARHAARCCSHTANLTQAPGWLPRAELTTMNIYIHQLDDGRGAAGVGD